jgi:transposase
MRTFDVRFKRKVVREYLSGKGGYKILAAKYDIADSLVRRWVGAYQHHGSAGLVRQRGRYTCEFKLEVLHRLAAENLSYRELAAIYNIGNPHSITMWQQQHKRGELGSPQCISPLDNSVPTKKKTSPRSPEPEQSEQADGLLRENQRLRAEVAYLKKVRALVLAKKLAQRKGRK